MLLDPKWNKSLEVVPDEVGLDLLKAAEYIEKNGWCQGTYAKEGGEVCLVGALMYSGAFLNYGKGAWQRLCAYLGKLPHKWNDEDCQNKEQAIEALRKAALT